MKYGTAKGRSNPLTVLYVPYMDPDAVTVKGGAKPKTPNTSLIRVNADNTTVCDICIDPNIADEKKRRWITGVCKFKYTAAEIIGTNLFTNNNPAYDTTHHTNDLEQYDTVENLVAAHQVSAIRGGLYIIACANEFFHKKASNTAIRIINKDNNSPTASVATNMASIYSIIAWVGIY
jgi:hypothetical protein